MSQHKFQMVKYWSDGDRAYLLEIPRVPAARQMERPAFWLVSMPKLSSRNGSKQPISSVVPFLYPLKADC
jgi:hypothetical protein